MTEIYKIVNGMAPPVMNSLFAFRNNEFIRNFYVLSTDLRETVNSGLGTNHLSKTEDFKVKIRTWKCDICPCILCKKF